MWISVLWNTCAVISAALSFAFWGFSQLCASDRDSIPSWEKEILKRWSSWRLCCIFSGSLPKKRRMLLVQWIPAVVEKDLEILLEYFLGCFFFLFFPWWNGEMITTILFLQEREWPIPTGRWKVFFRCSDYNNCYELCTLREKSDKQDGVFFLITRTNIIWKKVIKKQFKNRRKDDVCIYTTPVWKLWVLILWQCDCCPS